MEPQIHTRGDAVWVIVPGRTTIAGMRLVGDRWQDWTLPPCEGNGVGGVDAISPTTVVLCGRPGPVSDDGGDRLFLSTDGGTDFTEMCTTVWPQEVYAHLCGPGTDPMVVGLWEHTPDGHNRAWMIGVTAKGRLWATAYVAASPSAIGDCEFLSPTTRYTLEDDDFSAARLLMTYDGGASWNPVNFAGHPL
ncbi:hypothetical protein ACFYUD_36325 [Nocardia tengchongensis]|uniref:hypothetical protein n=1 Tax=Nocardia tengchongensis TaxID=2055889 RepID=UPI003683BA03